MLCFMFLKIDLECNPKYNLNFLSVQNMKKKVGRNIY